MLIQNNLHLVREIIEEIEDDNRAVLINLYQSKSFDRVNYSFLEVLLATPEFEPEFNRWISILFHNPTAVLKMNGKHSGCFEIEQSVRQGCPRLHFSLWNPCSVALERKGLVWFNTASFLSPVFRRECDVKT